MLGWHNLLLRQQGAIATGLELPFGLNLLFKTGETWSHRVFQVATAQNMKDFSLFQPLSGLQKKSTHEKHTIHKADTVRAPPSSSCCSLLSIASRTDNESLRFKCNVWRWSQNAIFEGACLDHPTFRPSEIHQIRVDIHCCSRRWGPRFVMIWVDIFETWYDVGVRLLWVPKYAICDPEHFCGSPAYQSQKPMNPRPSPPYTKKRTILVQNYGKKHIILHIVWVPELNLFGTHSFLQIIFCTLTSPPAPPLVFHQSTFSASSALSVIKSYRIGSSPCSPKMSQCASCHFHLSCFALTWNPQIQRNLLDFHGC